MRLIDADWVQVELECAPYYKCNSGTMRQLGNGINKPVTFSERETLLKWKDILAVLDEAPTIEAEPVRHGRWEEVWDYNYMQYFHQCSECGRDALTKEETMHDEVLSFYCPHCGAKMDKKEEL